MVRRWAESSSFGQTVFDYAPRSHGAADYAALAEEVFGTGGIGIMALGRRVLAGKTVSRLPPQVKSSSPTAAPANPAAAPDSEPPRNELPNEPQASACATLRPNDRQNEPPAEALTEPQAAPLYAKRQGSACATFQPDDPHPPVRNPESAIGNQPCAELPPDPARTEGGMDKEQSACEGQPLPDPHGPLADTQPTAPTTPPADLQSAVDDRQIQSSPEAQSAACAAEPDNVQPIICDPQSTIRNPADDHAT